MKRAEIEQAIDDIKNDITDKRVEILDLEEELAGLRERLFGLCESRCDHGSACKLERGHVPSDRHHTEHDCVFYDASP